jgi:O-methyltransferase
MTNENDSIDVKLEPLSLLGTNFNVTDKHKFNIAIRLLKESLFDNGATLFCSDNIITWNRNLSFLREKRFVDKLNDPDRDQIEKSTLWRTYILLYFAKLALELDGDFIECGVYKGSTAKDVLDECDLEIHGKKYWLYDLFEWKEGDEHTLLPEHENSNMYEKVVSRFSNHKEVTIIKGRVPESFSQGFPNTIAFCHIDMNHPAPEAGALKRVLPHLVKGGFIIFDDYGWWGYSAQKIALDRIAKSFEQEILELPTGQALLIKR